MLHVAATTKGGTYQPNYTCRIVEDRHVITHHDDSLTSRSSDFLELPSSCSL
jgi:hypothetical protein